MAPADGAVPALNPGERLLHEEVVLPPEEERTLRAAAAAFSSDSSQSIPPPNRMTKAFHEMKQTCPQEMQAYADCVVLGHREGNLDRGACQAEFDLVKACFRSARRSGRS